MRAAMKRAGGDPQKINPLVPVDLVIDHSVQVDEFGQPARAAQQREDGVRAQPRALRVPQVGPEGVQQLRASSRRRTGIVHQVNLEYLAKVVHDAATASRSPTRSSAPTRHTTMINGLGVVGWGVGGIEAEACMLGQPIYMVTPQVVGFKLHGKLPEGVDRDRPGADHHADPPQPRRRREVRRVLRRRPRHACPSPTARRSPTWPRSTARRSASSPSTSRRSRTCASPAAPPSRSTSSSATARSRASGGSARAEPEFTEVLELDLGTVDAERRRPAAAAGPRRAARRQAELPLDL